MTVSSLVVKIGANITELQAGLAKASQSIEKVGKGMEQMGKTLTTRVTAPLTALGAVAVRAFGIQEKAELQLRAALQANGRQVDKLFGSYNAFAQEMQRLTVVGDETTLAMLAQAESLGITGDSAQRAVKNSIAMQSAFGVNAQSALRYTAALEEGNATMLTRYIPALRDIKDDAERAAKAQEILGNAFSSAEAEAQGSTGQMIQMKNAVGDLMEQFGEIISKAIMPMVKRMKELAVQFQGLDNATKEQIVLFSGLAAAIGPALLIMGKLAVAIGFLMSPIGLLITAVVGMTVLIVRNFDVIKKKVVEIANVWIQLYNESAAVRGIFQSIGVVFGIAYDMISTLIKNLVTSFKGLGKVIMGALTLDGEKIKEGYTDVIKGLIDNASDLIESSKDRIQDAIQETFSPKAPIEFVTDADMNRALQKIADLEKRLRQSLFGGGGGGGGGTEEFSRGVETASVGSQKLSRELTNVVTSAKKFPQKMRDAAESIGQVSAMSQFAHNIAMNFTSSFGQGMANVVVQGEKLVDVLKNIGKLLLSSAIQFGLQALLTGGLGSGAGFFGSGGGLFGKIFGKKAISMSDGLITSGGDIVKFHPNDSILAMKDFSKLNTGGAQRVEVYGTIKGQDLFISSQRGSTSFNR